MKHASIEITTYVAGEITQKMNDRDFSFIRIETMEDAHKLFIIGPNDINPITKKHFLAAAAYSNEVNIANTHNFFCVLKLTYPDIFMEMKLRAESGRWKNRVAFRVNHTQETRTEVYDPSGVGYDWEVLVCVNGQLFIVPVFGRHRSQIFNIFSTYLTVSLTKDDLKNPTLCDDILDNHLKIINNQIAMCTVGDSSYDVDWCSFRAMASYPRSCHSFRTTDDKKNIVDHDSGKTGFTSTRRVIVDLFGNRIDVASDFMEAFMQCPGVRRIEDAYDITKSDYYVNLIKRRK